MSRKESDGEGEVLGECCCLVWGWKDLLTRSSNTLAQQATMCSFLVTIGRKRVGRVVPSGCSSGRQLVISRFNRKWQTTSNV